MEKPENEKRRDNEVMQGLEIDARIPAWQRLKDTQVRVQLLKIRAN